GGGLRLGGGLLGGGGRGRLGGLGELRLAHDFDLRTGLAPGALSAPDRAAPAAPAAASIAAALAAPLAGGVAIPAFAFALALLGFLAAAVGGVAGLPFHGRVGDLRAEEPDRADGVVV